MTEPPERRIPSVFGATGKWPRGRGPSYSGTSCDIRQTALVSLFARAAKLLRSFLSFGGMTARQ
jgi:hypothetical protein